VLDGLLERPGPQAIEISGEPGIGKTRLLDELCEGAGRRHYLVLRGAAAEFEREVPFAPVVDALDAYLATLDPARPGFGVRSERSCGRSCPLLG